MLKFRSFIKIPAEIRIQGYDAINQYAEDNNLKHIYTDTQPTLNNIEHKSPSKTIPKLKRILKAHRSE